MSSANANCYAEPHRTALKRDQPSVDFLKRQLSATIIGRRLQAEDDDGPSDVSTVYSLGPAERRARADVMRLKQRGAIKDAVARDGMKIAKFLFKPNTVYASVAEDDNGLIFYWKAGKMSIEIDVFPGEGFWWAVNDVAHESYQGSGYELQTERLKHSLNQFSKEVESANPAWRAQKF